MTISGEGDEKAFQNMSLKRLAAGGNIAVIGASGGVGRALSERLSRQSQPGMLYRISRSPPGDPVNGAVDLRVDIEDEQSIAAAAETIRERAGCLDLVIVATGVLHGEDGLKPEKGWQHLNADALTRYFRTNAIGPTICAKHFLPLLRENSNAVFAVLSARVGSIEDNRLGGWYGYRASKAALNMIVRTLSIELARRKRGAICVGLHPGTVATELSRPFQANVPDGRLFSPDEAAVHLLSVIDDLSETSSGKVFDWAGEPIPF